MTQSERICNEIGSRFFCKDFVYENLKYYNDKNNKIELCDGLFEYCGTYIALQIKERDKSKTTKTNEEWLNEVVYGDAVSQIIKTINGIKTNKISVNDLYHQPVMLKNDYLIYAVIIFDNKNITKYKRVIEHDNIKINVFSLEDYVTMMETLILPYDIISYLYYRLQTSIPNILIGENPSSIMFSKISSEQDFAQSFSELIYHNDPKLKEASLQMLALIDQYKSNLIKNNPNYKKILEILQMIKSEDSSSFIDRFWYAWENACNNKFDSSKNVLLQSINDNKRIGITFFSIGTEKFKDSKYYEILCDAKQLQHKLDTVLLITFIGSQDKSCQIDWIYYEKGYAENEKALQFYRDIGMFNGAVDREIYENLANKLLNNN